MAERRAALGFKVRTGRAVVVALGGTVDAPEILAKTRIDVAFSFDEGAVFHVAQERSLEEARAWVRDAQLRFVGLAREKLAAFHAQLDCKLVAAGMAAAAPKKLPPLEAILKSHPLVHAAEGELYRRVFSEASAALGALPVRTSEAALAKGAAAALGLEPATLAARMTALGKASGKPWAVDQKQATLAAWIAWTRA
jgi:hypothetical protein